jgi:hypothetical protein
VSCQYDYPFSLKLFYKKSYKPCSKWLVLSDPAQARERVLMKPKGKDQFVNVEGQTSNHQYDEHYTPKQQVM